MDELMYVFGFLTHNADAFSERGQPRRPLRKLSSHRRPREMSPRHGGGTTYRPRTRGKLPTNTVLVLSLERLLLSTFAIQQVPPPGHDGNASEVFSRPPSTRGRCRVTPQRLEWRWRYRSDHSRPRRSDRDFVLGGRI